jgi:hypothetical protein
MAMACQAGRPGRRRHRPSPASVPCTTSRATLYACAPGLRTLARLRRTAPRLLRRAAGTRPRGPVLPPPNSSPRRSPGQAEAAMSFTRPSRAQPPASRRRRSAGAPQPAQDQAGELADRRRPDCGRPSTPLPMQAGGSMGTATTSRSGRPALHRQSTTGALSLRSTAAGQPECLRRPKFRPPLHALAVSEHPHELPSISSTSRAARPNPRWPRPSAIGASRAALRPDLKEEEGHLLFRPLRFPLIPRSKSCV